MKGFQGYLRRFQFHKKMRILETCTILAEKEFEKLEDQADFNKRVDPLKYISRLLLSIFTFFIGLSILIIYCLKFMKMFGTTDTGDVFENPIDKLGIYVHETNETDGGGTLMMLELFICLLFCFSSVYFIWTTHHGNYTIGQRHAFFTFYRMKENETLFN